MGFQRHVTSWDFLQSRERQRKWGQIQYGGGEEASFGKVLVNFAPPWSPWNCLFLHRQHEL